MPKTHRPAAALGLLLALAPLAAFAGPDDKILPAFRFSDAGRCPPGLAFSVSNRGAQPILELYIRHAGTTGWGEDRLRDAELPPGGAKAFGAAAGIFDLLLMLADGRSVAMPRQELCRLSGISLEADGTLRMAPRR